MNEVPDYMTGEQYRNERLKEFKIADEDKNDKLDRRELLVRQGVQYFVQFICIFTTW